MPSATFEKVNDFVEHKNHGVIDFSSHAFILALSDTAPSAETSDPTQDGNGVLANVTQIDYTNLSSRALTVASSGQTGGTYKVVINDITLQASGGPVGPFRYVYLVDDTPTAPADPIVGYYDYGASITLGDGESLLVDFSDANGVLQDS